MRAPKNLVRTLLNLYPKIVCRREFRTQRFRRFNERPIEFAFLFERIGKFYPKRVLDVGTGTTALPHLIRNCGCIVTATDNVRDYWPSGMTNRHYWVIDDDITKTRLRSKFDMITCISVLEHIERADDAVRNMVALLNPGGHLVLTCPYNEREYARNVYKLPGSSYGQSATYITQAFSRKDLNRWTSQLSVAIVDQEYWQFWEGPHWTVGRQVIPPIRVSSEDKHQLTCILMRKTG